MVDHFLWVSLGHLGLCPTQRSELLTAGSTGCHHKDFLPCRRLCVHVPAQAVFWKIHLIQSRLYGEGKPRLLGICERKPRVFTSHYTGAIFISQRITVIFLSWHDIDCRSWEALCSVLPAGYWKNNVLFVQGSENVGCGRCSYLQIEMDGSDPVQRWVIEGCLVEC